MSASLSATPGRAVAHAARAASTLGAPPRAHSQAAAMAGEREVPVMHMIKAEEPAAMVSSVEKNRRERFHEREDLLSVPLPLPVSFSLISRCIPIARTAAA